MEARSGPGGNMRAIPAFVIITLLPVTLLLTAGDVGIPPRAKPSDYPVHQDTKTATLAAARVPNRQIEKMFSPEIARQYVVIEVAVYPESSFDVDWFDFDLKIGATAAHVEM